MALSIADLRTKKQFADRLFRGTTLAGGAAILVILTLIAWTVTDKSSLVFMDQESFEQYTIAQEVMGEGVRWLMDGMICNLTYWNDRVIEVEPPPHVNVRITYTEPAVRGNTSGNISKAATVETGTEIQVPAFIEQGETVRIDTRTGQYVERVRV